jgi:hypothetical protein
LWQGLDGERREASFLNSRTHSQVMQHLIYLRPSFDILTDLRACHAPEFRGPNAFEERITLWGGEVAQYTPDISSRIAEIAAAHSPMTIAVRGHPVVRGAYRGASRHDSLLACEVAERGGLDRLHEDLASLSESIVPGWKTEQYIGALALDWYEGDRLFRERVCNGTFAMQWQANQLYLASFDRGRLSCKNVFKLGAADERAA